MAEKSDLNKSNSENEYYSDTENGMTTKDLENLACVLNLNFVLHVPDRTWWVQKMRLLIVAQIKT